MAGEPVEHAAGADRGELLAVADGDQLRPGALDELGEASRRLWSTIPASSRMTVVSLAHVEVPVLGARDQRVQGERVPGEGGAVGAEALGGGAGHGDPDRLAAGVLLGARGGVDHDALAGPGGADQDRRALGAGEDFERVVAARG